MFLFISVYLHNSQGVLQGSILGLLHFLMYIIDLTQNLYSNPKLYANDTIFNCN